MVVFPLILEMSYSYLQLKGKCGHMERPPLVVKHRSAMMRGSLQGLN